MEPTAIVALTALALADDVTPANETDVTIEALYPNTVHPFNRGEFVLVTVADRTSIADWEFIDDGVQWAKPPPKTINGTVAFSRHPEKVKPLVDVPVIELEGTLQLAVDGEELTIYAGGEVVDHVAYAGPAPETHLWKPAREDWIPLGFESIDIASDSTTVTPFVLPDAPTVAFEALESAEDRLLVGGYTLTHEGVIEALIDAHSDGVHVAVHVEGAPVGGISHQMGDALDRLVDAGITATVSHGPYTRFRFHHAKYAVVDDTVLVMTENWKPAGVGGNASRGWGAVIESAPLADHVAAIFEADTDWQDAQDWATAGDDIDRHEDEGATSTFTTDHQPTTLDDVPTTVFLSPDHAEDHLTWLIDNATESVAIKQVRIADVGVAPMAAAIDAARAGVSVRVLLSGAWYVEEENEAFKATLEAIADAEDLPLSVSLTEPRGRFDQLHAKGLIVDESVVVVSSINWNNTSIGANRELGVIFEDEDVAGYYLEVFEADWPTTPSWTIDIGLAIVTLAVAAGVGIHIVSMPVEGPAAAESETYTER